MIFEVDYSVIRRHLTTIQKTLTGTEWNKSEFTNVEFHVNEEGVFISYQGDSNSQLEYQFELREAEPILNGSLRVNARELLEVLRTFSKASGVLLFERDGNELRIDDGVYEPELIILSQENELEEVFSVTRPTESVTLSKDWLEKRMELARINNRTTFLPATNHVALLVRDNTIYLRSFNLTNLYESKIKFDDSLPDLTFLLVKTASARLSRLLKTIKDKEIQLFANETSMYVFTDEFIFRFDAETDEDAKIIYEELPIGEMARSEDTAPLPTSVLKQLTKIKRGAESPESVCVNWSGNNLQVNVSYSLEDSNLAHYPFKTIQKVASKWMPEMNIGKGLEENQNPLIIRYDNEETEDVFIIMRMGEDTERE